MTSTSPIYMGTQSPSVSSTCSHADSRVQVTFEAVNWDALSSLGCKLHQVDSSHWGEQVSGGYNLVRFLHLHDAEHTTLVARVPLRSNDDVIGEDTSKYIESEVATMEYVERYTNIPLPHVYHYNSHAEGDVHSPYILMSKVEGVQLSSVWNDMDDAKRRIILGQVIDILLELWSHRFDQDGFLFKRADGGDGKDAWSSSVIQDLGDTEPAISHSNAVNYWLARTNAQLQDICEANFGFIGKFSHYSFFWFMRSLIPALFDPSTDDHGFPLCPGDFHSQNIIITDVDTHPRITGVIDWESSGPTFTTTFAQYPLFIVDHPAWEEEDHPLRERNIRDQTTFDELIREAELIRNPVSGPRLSHLISNGYGIYLFKQMIQSPRIMFSFLYPALFAHVFGEYNEDFSHQYYTALRQKGILKKDTERFNEEHRVWHEAQKVLGEDLVGHDLKLCEFKDLVSKYLDRFDDGGIVREWMLSVN